MVSISRASIAVNKHKEPYDVYIGRGSKWGNPYKLENNTPEERERVLALYEKYFWESELVDYIDELIGKRLGCSCKPKPCHGDFLAKLANKKARGEELR